MKKTIIHSLLLLNLSVYAQMNDRFYGGGLASFNQDVGVYVSNVTVDGAWRDIQQYPSSSYVWTNLDTRIQANQTAGLRTMITVKCTSPITSADTTPGTCAYIFSSATSDNGSSWWPYDTTAWKNFVNALVDRYDGDGTNDATWLNTNYKITQWHIGQEWQRIWCTQNPPDSLSTAQEFTNYVNLTYDVIKAKQPLSQISFAGIDTRHDLEAYYDGYSMQTAICLNPSCTNPITINNPSPMDTISGFLAKRRNILYILRNTLSDEIDIHQYGRWTEIPKVVQWLKDSANLGTRKVVFYEGGGPFCKACEKIYHSAGDSDGRLPDTLIRDNASYIVYYFITGFASGVKNMHWHVGPEYTVWGATWGDLDLKSINYVSKPSYYTYRFLAKTVFSNADADTVVQITESNPNLYHYQVQQLPTLAPFIDVAWSTNQTDSIIINGTGTLNTWDIPITCNSLYPTACDSVFPMNTFSVSGSHTIALNDGVPVFYGWNNVLTGSNQIEKSKLQLFIYPNPYNSSTTLQTNYNFKDATLTVYSLYGQQVKQIKNISGQTITLHRDNLQSGLYFLQLSEANKLITRKKIIITD